jgi:hypothetical protein
MVKETPEEREYRIITKAERSGDVNMAFKLMNGADPFTIASAALSSTSSKSARYRFRSSQMGDKFLEDKSGSNISRKIIRGWAKLKVQEIEGDPHRDPYPFVHLENRRRQKGETLSFRTIMNITMDELVDRRDRGILANVELIDFGN